MVEAVRAVAATVASWTATVGGFGGGGGGGARPGGGGFGGGAGGTPVKKDPRRAEGGFGGGSSANSNGGGGAGLGGAVFVQEGGTLRLGGNLAVSGNAVAGGGGGTVAATGFGSGIFLQGNGTFTVTPDTGQVQTISDDIADQSGQFSTSRGGSWQLVKTGRGTTILSGKNSYSGLTDVKAGALNIQSGSALGYSVNIEVHPGAALELQNDAHVQTDRGFHRLVGLSGTGVAHGGALRNVAGANSFIGSLILKDDTLINTEAGSLALRGRLYSEDNTTKLTLTGAGATAILASVSKLGSLIKEGSGRVILAGSNSYDGQTVVSAGVLNIQSNSALGSTVAGTTVATGATLELEKNIVVGKEALTLAGVGAGNVGALRNIGGSNEYSGDIKLGSAVRINPDDGALTLSGDIVGEGNKLALGGAGEINVTGALGQIGGLTKDGKGTLILSSDNTYTGGIRVSGGTLRSNSDSLQGPIVNNASVIFDQDFDGTYAGAMSGNGRLTKEGNFILTLTGTNSAGRTFINAGALAVNGTLTSPKIRIERNATLRGTGKIAGDVSGPGNFEPGNSIGTITVDGNLTMNKGTIEIEVNANGASDRIDIIGAGHKANLKASTLSVVAEAGTYTPNTRYTIVTAPAGGIANFGSLSGGVGFLTPSLSFDPTHLYLSMILPANAFRSAGQTANQRSVGGALDAVAASGNVGGLVTTMANLPMSHGASALQALSGQPYADFGTVNVRGSQLFMNAIGRQMAVERGTGPGGTKSVALAEACADTCDAGAGTPSRFGAWLSGIGSTGSVLGDGNASSLTYTLGGTAFGIDYRLDPRFLVGIAGGYVGGTQWVNGFSGTGNVDALSVALYGSFTQGGFYADALVGYANARNRMQRVVSIPGLATGIASGDTSANQFLGQFETGYRFDLGFPAKTSITPFGRLQVGSSNQAGFSESGTNLFNLAFQSQTTTSVRTTIGADFAARFDVGGGRPLDIGLRLGWLHEFADTARPITAAFAAAPGQPFTVSGATPQRDSAVVGFSAATPISDRASLFASYDGEVGGGTTNHAGRVGFRLTW